MIRVERFINTFYTSNTYILSSDGANYVWLVDCGDYVSKIREHLLGKYVRGVLLTHTHADHIYGLNDLIEDFPDVEIYTNDFGRQALSDPKLNVSKYHTEISDFVLDIRSKVKIAGEGDGIYLFPSITAQVISTPGHDKSSLSYIVENCLFTGDSYIPGVRLTALFPNSNKLDAKVSYDRLKELSSEFHVFPGHGEV